jgi:hypothetical protein
MILEPHDHAQRDIDEHRECEEVHVPARIVKMRRVG